jgi:hypothetical protein
MGDFHTTVYQPASVSLTPANVDTFLNTKATSGFLLENKTEIKKLLVAYFVNQTAGPQNANLTAAQIASNARAANSGYASMLADLGQTSGTTSSGTTSSGTTSSGAQSQMTANNNPNVAGISNNMKKGNIWGPAWTGLGDNSGSGLGVGDRIYPILLGPKPSLSKMVEGGGIAPISQSESLVKSGTLPDPTSTGSDPNSQFFGTSRMPGKDGGPGGAGGADGTSRAPGDQDLFPNPYVEFTPSSGSSKTEPVPYLSDFSAFLN